MRRFKKKMNLKQPIRAFLCFCLIFLTAFGCCGCLESENVGSSGYAADLPDTSLAVSSEECNHSFTPASCTEPPTCTVCGLESGEAAGHNWIEANCTEPKKCSVCGTALGEALGHSFTSATCTSPEICSVCRAEGSSALGHNYSGGSCSRCSAKDPNYVSATMVWIPTKGGKKYHRNSSCSNMSDPEQVTKEEAEQLGFTPCKKCY